MMLEPDKYSNDLIIFKENSKWFRYVLFLAALIFGVLLLDFSRTESVFSVKGYAFLSGFLLFLFSGLLFRTHKMIFRVSKRSVSVYKGTIRGETLKTYSFDDIKNIIEVRHATTFESTSGRTMPSSEWRLYLKLDSGQIPIPSHHFNSQDEAKAAASNLATHIGINISSTSIEDQAIFLLKSGRRMDAVSLIRERNGVNLEEATEIVDQISKKTGGS